MKPLFDHFSFLAAFYERLIKPSYPDKLLSLAELDPDGSVLDIGGGTGRVGQFLAEKSARVIIADESFKMLQEAQKKDHLAPICTNSEELAFADASFDRIIMVDVFHHVSDQSETANELCRVLKPGGAIVIEEPDIHKAGVKMVALMEKITLMRSHFLDAQQVAALFADTGAGINIDTEGHTFWVVIRKSSTGF